MKRRMISVLIAMALLFNAPLTMPIASFEGKKAKAAVDTGTGYKVKEVSLGYYHSAAITENGDLYCWGYNSNGQIGNGTTENQTIPIKVLESVKAVSLGDCYSAAITENDDLYCWGDNSDGQIGSGTTGNQLTPVKVLGNVKTVSLGDYHSAAITKNGDLYCWGDNDFGQIGNDTTKDQSIPVKVLGNVKTVSLGGAYSAAITEKGDLYCWGYNRGGEIGNGTTQDQSTPVKVLGNVKTVSLSLGIDNYSAAITENGDLYCWGNDFAGQIGNGTTGNQLTPVKVLGNVKTVFLREHHSAAITENDDLYCWGDNSDGQVGNGTTRNQSTPIKVLGNVKTISLGDNHSAAVTENGDLYCWGDNSDGQVGNGTTGDQLIPVKVLGNVKTVSLSLGSYGYSAAITENGNLYCWGYNFYGQVGNSTENNQFTPVKVLETKNDFDNNDKDEGKQKKSIAVFTSEKSMEIKTGKSMWMGFGLLDENSGLLDDKWRKMSVVVSDPTVIALSDYTETEYGYSLEVIGKKQGASNITITDTESGISTIVTAFVQDDYANTYSYAINDIASFYPNNDFEKNIETNIYNLNGLYVNKYQCVKSTNSYNISFDVYNSKYYTGAVDIYDENGMWIGYEEINKYSNISSIWDTGEQAYFLISDTVTGKMLTYEQASFSKHTHIDIEVPEGGYFTISNNISESPGTFFINAFEILFEGASTAFDLFTSGSTKESALTSFKKEAKKSFATRLIEARNEGLKDNVKRQSQKIMLDSMKTKIRNITKENIKTGLKDKLTSTDTMCSDIASLAEDMLAPQSFNIEWKPIFESATGIGESFFTKFAGPAGIALKGCFALNDSASKILMTKQMAESSGTPYVTIFSSVDKGYINPYGVMVNTNGNIDAESVLQVFRVSNSDAIEVLLDSNNPLEIHELYNICFVKDDTLVQPNGKVMVQIPIPQGMKGNTCKVYRQETNGNWTILDARVQGNYLVFETDHFSLYALIGESDNLIISSLPNKTSYKEGETLDTNGLTLDLNGQLITEGYICEPTVLSGNGKQFVKVIYGHSATKFEVNVEKSISTNKPDNRPTETSKPNQSTVLPTESPTLSKPVTVGTKTTVDTMKYKVTKVNNNGASEVTLIGTTRKKSDKRFTALNVGNTVKIKGKAFKITAIGNNAFRGCKKLKSVMVGKNVKKIGTKAFYDCKKLKKIIIKTKQLQIKKVGNKAFKGIYSKVNIKVPKPKLKSYKKIFRAKGVGKGAKIHT